MLPTLLQIFSVRELFASECLHPEATFTPQCRSAFSNNHIIFVDGLLNEAAQLVGSYFCDNITEAERVGFSHDHLGYLSSESIPENADKLFVDVQKIYAHIKKPIVLIGHSKGGAECLYTVLKYPELLLSNIIDRVVIIHGAIGGSPLADNVCDNFMGRTFTQYLDVGLLSLQPETARSNFQEIFKSFKEIISLQQSNQNNLTPNDPWGGIPNSHTSDLDLLEDLSSRIFYIRGQSPPEDEISWGVKFVLFFCKQGLDSSIPNDGLLYCSDQMLSGFGTDLGIIDADHIDLVIGGMVTVSDSERRKAFTRATLSAIYQPK